MIVAAAVRIRQPSGSGLDDIIVSMPRPFRHHAIMQRMHLRFGVENVHPDDQGFLTDGGVFVGRKTALEVVRTFGQPLKREPHGDGSIAPSRKSESK